MTKGEAIKQLKIIRDYVGGDEALTYALAVLERVSDVEMLEQFIDSFDSESSDTFPKELAQAIVKELTKEAL